MALCELIEMELSDDIIIKKFPDEDFKIGSRLVVHPFQSAVFVRDGAVYKTFEQGAYTLNSKIFPFITKLVGRVIFGTKNAFNCQVYFINTALLEKIKYGVSGINCNDAKYRVPVTLGAHGSYIMTAQNPELILRKLCGGRAVLSTDVFRDKFLDEVESLVPEYLKKILYGTQMSVIDADACHSDIAFAIKAKLNDSFSRYGVYIDTFSIKTSINSDDMSRIKDIDWRYHEKLKEVDYKAYERERQGYSYQDEQLYSLAREYIKSPNAMRVSEQMLLLNSSLREEQGVSPFGLLLYGILSDAVKRVVPDNYSKFAGQGAAGGRGRRSNGRDNVCPVCGKVCGPDASFCPVCGERLR